jgi:hypothetical protein
MDPKSFLLEREERIGEREKKIKDTRRKKRKKKVI